MEENLQNKENVEENKIEEVQNKVEEKETEKKESEDSNKVEIKETSAVDTKKVNYANRKLLDYNASWLTMFLYLGYLIVIFFVQKNTFESNANILKNQYAFYFVSLIIGACAAFVLHNLFKIIGAMVAGYKLLYINFFGLKVTSTDSGVKIKFQLTLDDFLSTSMRFVSKDEKVEHKPLPIFLTGFLGDLILVGICLALYFVSSKTSSMHYYAIYSLAYGLILALYEFIPVRQDEPNDMYNIIRTISADDKKAYNAYYINVKREIDGNDPLVITFDNYESFYKSQALYFNYLDSLYNDNLEAALNYVQQMNYNIGYLPDNDKYLATLEMIYLRFLVNDNEEADKLYLSLKGENKSACIRPSRLSGYKTAILIMAFVVKDKDRLKTLVDGYKKILKSIENKESRRLTCENKFFLDSYKLITSKHPEYNLPEEINLD